MFLPTQMVLESSLLPWEHSQVKEPATFRQIPLMQGLDSHSLMSERQRNNYDTEAAFVCLDKADMKKMWI